MTLDVVGRAIELIRRDETGSCWFAGPRSEELVAAAEKALGFTLPPSFRLFALELGAGSVGAEEIFGVTSPNFDESSVPNGIWLTLSARHEWGLPQSMLVVYFDGGVDYYVMCCTSDDPPLMIWRPGVSKVGDDLPVVADNFGEFLMSVVRSGLGAD